MTEEKTDELEKMKILHEKQLEIEKMTLKDELNKGFKQELKENLDAHVRIKPFPVCKAHSMLS